MEQYDVIVIGAGPAGMSAAIYAVRGGMKTLIIENKYPGGQIIITDQIDNYPGIIENPSGAELAMLFQKHIKKFDVKTVIENIDSYDLSKEKHYIIKTNKNEYETKSIIFCTGASPRKLNIPGEKQFTGRGVSYCATCDAAFFRDKTVAVIGGGNTALEEALYLTKFVKKLYIIHRRDKFRGFKSLSEKIFKNEKIEIIFNSKPLSINGEQSVNSLNLQNIKSNKEQSLNLDGVFIFVGYTPNIKNLPENLKLNDSNYIIVGNQQETNIPGIFAAGDVTDNFLKQVITACGTGATAGFSAMRYIDNY